MLSIVKGMEETLTYFSEHENIDNALSFDELVHYIESLVAGQVAWSKEKDQYAWLVAPDHNMPSDARVDFLFRPTYIAVATLTLFRQRYPEEAKNIMDFDTVLRRGMAFSLLRGFSGHGCEGTLGTIDAMNIFAKGKVCSFLLDNDICPPMLEALKDTVKELKACIADGMSKSTWNEDCREEITLFLESYDEDTSQE